MRLRHLADLPEGLTASLVQAYVYAQAIDRATYDRELAELDEALTFGQLELRDAELEDIDMEAALGFARHLLTRTYQLWDNATATQKSRLQTLIFPEGVTFDGEALGTPVTSLLFSYLGAVQEGGEGLVDQFRANWNHLLSWLRDVQYCLGQEPLPN